jgi:TolB protein
MNSDGTGVKQISDFTNDYNVVGSPTWSPDGKKLAMGLTDYTVATPNTDVYLMTASGANNTRLTSTEGIDADPTFSPDGQRIAFASARDPDGDYDIWTMNVDGTDLDRLTNCDPGMQCRQPRWAPDGSKVAYVQANNAGSSVVVVGAKTKLLVFFTAIGFKDPFWSPDGLKLAIVYNDGFKEILRAINPNGAGYSDVMSFVGADIRAGSWSR